VSFAADELIRASKTLSNALKDGRSTTTVFFFCILIAEHATDPLTRAVIGEWSSEDSKLAIAWSTADILRSLKNGEVYVAGEDLEGIAFSFGPKNDLECVFPRSLHTHVFE
jgi:hypothetical protein